MAQVLDTLNEINNNPVVKSHPVMYVFGWIGAAILFIVSEVEIVNAWLKTGAIIAGIVLTLLGIVVKFIEAMEKLEARRKRKREERNEPK
jgi:hypothetical protein